MTETEHLIAFIAMALMIITVLTIGTLSAAEIIGRRPQDDVRRPETDTKPHAEAVRDDRRGARAAPACSLRPPAESIKRVQERASWCSRPPRALRSRRTIGPWSCRCSALGVAEPFAYAVAPRDFQYSFNAPLVFTNQMIGPTMMNTPGKYQSPVIAVTGSGRPARR